MTVTAQTESLLRQIMAMDGNIAHENVEKAISILSGSDNEPHLVHVLRFKQVRELLGVHRRTLEYYIAHGYLDRVYGLGKRAIGISRDSYLRFTTERRVVSARNKAV